MLLLRALLGCVGFVAAAMLPTYRDSPTRVEERDAQCTNGPLSRACWNNGYSIATDFDQKHPVTGVTVQYTFEITNGTCNPDGHGSRSCFLTNGQYPGPTTVANWGDTLIVNVINRLQNNGTSIHFHGVRQLNSCGSDGVAGITECPIAPGTSGKYTMLVTQFGTSWYHSHFSAQYGDGVVGSIIFNGPASANYDIDLGVYPLSDWFYPTVYQSQSVARANAQLGQPPPNADNVLINGTNQNADGGGKYNYVSVAKGKKYRLRLINTAVDNYFRVSLDGHSIQVMSADFIPIKPFYTNWLLLGTGQRYDVVINANQTASNYWFRADAASDCTSGNNFYGRAIWTYTNATIGAPTTTAANFTADCTEPLPAPFWVQPIPSGSFTSLANDLDLGLTKAQAVDSGDTIVVWALNDSSLDVTWSNPTLTYLQTGNTSYPSRYNVLSTSPEGNWNYWLIQQASNTPAIPHPVHLHGHDFFVLGQGKSKFDPSTANLNWATPPRRDTATIYGNGWLALAFNSNNPGAWLMHCHITWHISAGLGVQFLEAPDSIVFPDHTTYNNQCAAWKAYESGAYYSKDDSGV